MKELHELREKLCDELKGYGKKEMTAGSLDVIDKLAHAVKNIDKIINESGYSNKRDSMGRYARNYSMADELRSMMHEAPDERTRDDMRRLVSRLEGN